MLSENTEIKRLELEIMLRHLRGVVTRCGAGSRYGETAKRQIEKVLFLKKNLFVCQFELKPAINEQFQALNQGFLGN